MLTVQGIVFIAGAVFILIAIIGGGFTIKELTVPAVSRNKRIGSGVVGILFISYSLLMPLFSTFTSKSEMQIIHADDRLPSSEEDGIEVSNLTVTSAHKPPQLNDLITVQFLLENIGQKPVTLDYIFTGTLSPAHISEETPSLGNFDINEVFEPGDDYLFKKSGTLNQIGEWLLFPCYKIAGEESDDEGYCPEAWNSFPVNVVKPG